VTIPEESSLWKINFMEGATIFETVHESPACCSSNAGYFEETSFPA
jgi:hypothetical protein